MNKLVKIKAFYYTKVAELGSFKEANKLLEMRMLNQLGWHPIKTEDEINFNNTIEYRIKPKTHIVHGREVPAPLNVKPEVGAEYWVINQGVEDNVSKLSWTNHQIDKLYFERKLCFATQEDALANFYARFPDLNKKIGEY